MSHSVFTPHSLFLTRGTGTHREKLASFELALREAGINAKDAKAKVDASAAAVMLQGYLDSLSM